MITCHLTDEWPLERIEAIWPEVVRHLGRVEDIYPKEVRLQHILGEILAGKQRLWVCMDGERVVVAFTTWDQVVEATGRKVLWMANCGGERLHEVLFDCLPTVEAWGRAQGMDVIKFYGRSGWRRVLKSHGYEPDVEIVAKELSRG